MSVYTTVTPEQLGVWLTQHNVGTLVDLRGISAGIENTNYFVTTTAGRYVLTLFEKLTAAELPFYLDLMAHLADRGMPSARPIPDLEGRLLGELNGKPAALVSFLPGKDVERPTKAHCAAVGTMLARIHRAGGSYRAHMDNPRGLQWWQAVMPEIVRFLPADDAALLRREVEFQARQPSATCRAARSTPISFATTCCSKARAFSGVIDFYFACTDALLYDVAICVNDWCVRATGSSTDARRTALLTSACDARCASRSACLAGHAARGRAAILDFAPLRFSPAAPASSRTPRTLRTSSAYSSSTSHHRLPHRRLETIIGAV